MLETLMTVGIILVMILYLLYKVYYKNYNKQRKIKKASNTFKIKKHEGKFYVYKKYDGEYPLAYNYTFYKSTIHSSDKDSISNFIEYYYSFETKEQALQLQKELNQIELNKLN